MSIKLTIINRYNSDHIYYNYMWMVIRMIDTAFISERIAQLRTEKNVSARDMSLSLGQSQSYINNIENKKSLPSMEMFLYICDFLGVEPEDFFARDTASPSLLYEAVEIFRTLTPKQLELMIAVAKEMK